jgi:hypothetical protein
LLPSLELLGQVHNIATDRRNISKSSRKNPQFLVHDPFSNKSTQLIPERKIVITKIILRKEITTSSCKIATNMREGQALPGTNLYPFQP